MLRSDGPIGRVRQWLRSDTGTHQARGLSRADHRTEGAADDENPRRAPRAALSSAARLEQQIEQESGQWRVGLSAVVLVLNVLACVRETWLMADRPSVDVHVRLTVHVLAAVVVVVGAAARGAAAGQRLATSSLRLYCAGIMLYRVARTVMSVPAIPHLFQLGSPLYCELGTATLLPVLHFAAAEALRWHVGVAFWLLSLAAVHHIRGALQPGFGDVVLHVLGLYCVVSLCVVQQLRQRRFLTAVSAVVRDVGRRADALTRARTRFVAAMSHELRTPLNGVLGLTDALLETRPLHDGQRELIESVRTCGRLLLALSTRALQFSDARAAPAAAVDVAAAPGTAGAAFSGIHTGASASSLGSTPVYSLRKLVDRVAHTLSAAAQSSAVDDGTNSSGAGDSGGGVWPVLPAAPPRIRCSVAASVPDTLVGAPDRMLELLLRLLDYALQRLHSARPRARGGDGGADAADGDVATAPHRIVLRIQHEAPCTTGVADAAASGATLDAPLGLRIELSDTGPPLRPGTLAADVTQLLQGDSDDEDGDGSRSDLFLSHGTEFTLALAQLVARELGGDLAFAAGPASASARPAQPLLRPVLRAVVEVRCVRLASAEPAPGVSAADRAASAAALRSWLSRAPSDVSLRPVPSSQALSLRAVRVRLLCECDDDATALDDIFAAAGARVSFCDPVAAAVDAPGAAAAAAVPMDRSVGALLAELSCLSAAAGATGGDPLPAAVAAAAATASAALWATQAASPQRTPLMFVLQISSEALLQSLPTIAAALDAALRVQPAIGVLCLLPAERCEAATLRWHHACGRLGRLTTAPALQFVSDRWCGGALVRVLHEMVVRSATVSPQQGSPVVPLSAGGPALPWAPWSTVPMSDSGNAADSAAPATEAEEGVHRCGDGGAEGAALVDDGPVAAAPVCAAAAPSPASSPDGASGPPARARFFTAPATLSPSIPFGLRLRRDVALAQTSRSGSRSGSGSASPASGGANASPASTTELSVSCSSSLDDPPSCPGATPSSLDPSAPPAADAPAAPPPAPPAQPPLPPRPPAASLLPRSALPPPRLDFPARSNAAAPFVSAPASSAPVQAPVVFSVSELAAAAAAAVYAGVPVSAGSAPASGALVLIVEDNEINVRVLQRLLGKLQLRSVVARTGLDALQLLRGSNGPTAPYALVLMDLHMPGIDGLETTRHLRQLERERGWSRMPVLAVSASVAEGVLHECAAAGLDGFVSKPVTIPALRRELVRLRILQEATAEPDVARR